MATALYYLNDPFAPDPNRPMRFGVAVILEANGKILLEKRRDSYSWGLVSGDIKNSETFKQCAVRQTHKETGITLFEDELRFLDIFDDPSRIVSFEDGNIYRIVSIAYSVHLDDEETVIPDKGSLSLAWVDIDDLEDYPLILTHKEIVEAYLKHKNK